LGGLERLRWSGVEEVKRSAALHLDRRSRAVSEHEGRCVERRVASPPAFPVGVVLPAGRAELVGAHDLGADAVTVALSERNVDSRGAAGVPEPGAEHPLVQTLTRVAERCIERLRLTRGEAVKGDRHVVDSCQWHPNAPLSVTRLAVGSVETDQTHRGFSSLAGVGVRESGVAYDPTWAR